MLTPRARRSVFTVGLALILAVALEGTALAVVHITVVSSDPYSNLDAYHRSEVEPDSFSYGSTLVSTFQVGRFPDGGADDIGWATRIFPGPWANNRLPSMTPYSAPQGPWARVTDPSVAYDPVHGQWLIASLALDGSLTGRAVLVSRSATGMLPWSDPITVAMAPNGSFFDKPWIACDSWASSFYYGHCYVEWDDVAAGGRLNLSRSLDGGLTWTPSTVPVASVTGGQLVVQPNGTVALPATSSIFESFVSTDGGSTFGGPYPVASIYVHGAPGMRDGRSLASAEVDGAGTIYMAWEDCRFRPGCSADDIVYSTSADGKIWTAPRRLPIVVPTSPVELFLPGVGVDRTTSGASAHLLITFYAVSDVSCTPSTCAVTAAYVSSTTGGRTWVVGTTIFPPFPEPTLPDAGGYFLGDYISTSFGPDGKAYPVIPDALMPTSTCTLGTLFCHVAMVVPTDGLTPMPKPTAPPYFDFQLASTA